MNYYAFIDNNNVVVQVIPCMDEIIEGQDPEIWFGQHKNMTCKRTSYLTRGGVHLEGGIPFRKNFASIGFSYDPVLDAFIPPSPGENWSLDEESCLWGRNSGLGIVGDASPIIQADGVDFVTVYIVGANPNSTQDMTVNDEPFSINIGADGYGEFELSSDVSGLLLVEWGGLSLEVAAL